MSAEVIAAIKLIEKLEPRNDLTKDEIEIIKGAIKNIYTESPGAIQMIKNYFINVSSSMAGSVVLDTIKMLGII